MSVSLFTCFVLLCVVSRFVVLRYPSYPFFDAMGLVYTLYAPNGQTLPGGTVVKFADVNVYNYPNTTEYVADYVDFNSLIDRGNVANGGSVGVYTGSAMSQCAAPSATGIPATLPALQTYSFCFSSSSAAGGSAYQLGVSGTFSVYSTPITTSGNPAYAVAAMNGTRWFYGGNNHEFATQNNIAAVPSDWVASTVGISVSNLYYPRGSPTGAAFDTAGLLFSVSGAAASSAGYLDAGTNYVKLSSMSTGKLQEQAYIGSGGMLFPVPSPNVAFFATMDNGASASTVLSTQCMLTFPAGIVWNSGGPTNNTSGSRSSSSSTGSSNGGGVVGSSTAGNNGNAGNSANNGNGHNLSNGDIAGIVIGCVVGGMLLLGLVLACCLLARGAGGKSTGKSSQYDTQTDMSKVGQSQVEMQPAGEVSRVGESRMNEDGEEHTEV